MPLDILEHNHNNRCPAFESGASEFWITAEPNEPSESELNANS